MQQRREIDFQSFDQVLVEIENLRQGNCAHCGNWDLGQTVGHLARSVNSSMDGFPSKAPWLIRKLFKRMALKQVVGTRKIPQGFKVKGQIVPEAGANVAEMTAKLREAFDRFEKHEGDFAPHPFFERLDKPRWKQLHLIHCAHHLSFQMPSRREAHDPAGS
jgi:hypothetical protein